VAVALEKFPRKISLYFKRKEKGKEKGRRGKKGEESNRNSERKTQITKKKSS